MADPKEAESYPAPASVHHAPAATPSKAVEAAVRRARSATPKSARRCTKPKRPRRRPPANQHNAVLKPVAGGQSIGGNGKIPIPTGVPEVIQKVIAGANEIADFPYVFGGGHGSFVDHAYDCSGSVSYALAAGGLLSSPEVSGELAHWGVPGPGRYITVYANAGHTYMYVDGILYDTAGRSGVYASRWLVGATDNSGYAVRHWPGLLAAAGGRRGSRRLMHLPGGARDLAVLALCCRWRSAGNPPAERKHVPRRCHDHLDRGRGDRPRGRLVLLLPRRLALGARRVAVPLPGS